jgi:hypothetical protein
VGIPGITLEERRTTLESLWVVGAGKCASLPLVQWEPVPAHSNLMIVDPQTTRPRSYHDNGSCEGDKNLAHQDDDAYLTQSIPSGSPRSRWVGPNQTSTVSRRSSLWTPANEFKQCCWLGRSSNHDRFIRRIRWDSLWIRYRVRETIMTVAHRGMMLTSECTVPLVAS